MKLAGQDGINALLANADPCAQQKNADAMVTFAKSAGINNKQALIDNAIAYRKHPRNALNINGVVPSTPFCQEAPTNPELNGLVNGQLVGVDPGLFGSPALGIFAFGDRKLYHRCPSGDWADQVAISSHLPLRQEAGRCHLHLHLNNKSRQVSRDDANHNYCFSVSVLYGVIMNNDKLLGMFELTDI